MLDGDPLPWVTDQVDRVDATIIAALRANARTTYAELGRLAGLSAPAVHERVGKLEVAGVITGYHADVAAEALGLPVCALVGIVQSAGGDQDEIAAALAALPEIEDCWFVAGDEAFVVKVRVGSVADLEQTVGTLRRIPGVAQARTTVVLSTRFEGRAVSPPSFDGSPDSLRPAGVSDPVIVAGPSGPTGPSDADRELLP